MNPRYERSSSALLLLIPLLFAANGGCSSGDTLDMGHDNPETGPCAQEDCGPAPGIPNWQCDDGTLAGPTCVRGDDGTCAYQFTECPGSCGDVPHCELQCPAGTKHPTDEAGCVHTCECVPGACAWEDCPPPAPGAANYTCPDGSLAGPACLPSDDGGCGWQFLQCSTAVCPAAVPDAGESCASVGAMCTYPTESDDGGAYHLTATCEASGWQISLHVDSVACTLAAESRRVLDATACADHPISECSSFPGQTNLEALTREVSTLADQCGGVLLESHLQVSFQNGCASELAFESPGPIDPAPLFDCLAPLLATRHYRCAESVECARLDPSLLR